MVSHWFTQLALAYLLLSGLCALAILLDLLIGARQKMMVMNFVWPITGLWAGPIGLLVYWRIGRQTGSARNLPKAKKPFWQSVLTGTSHCAAGCTVGDFIGEWIVFLTGLMIAGSMLWADYVIDFAFAYVIGVAFQYYSIAPMRGIHGWSGIKAALKADTISLIAFEIGMFAWMALSSKVLFHPRLEPTQAAYWFVMQIAMFVGFLTSYPANWWLIRKGIKEAM